MGTAREGEAPAEPYGVEQFTGSAGASPSHCRLMRNIPTVATSDQNTVWC
jgi:hypothetical protein